MNKEKELVQNTTFTITTIQPKINKPLSVRVHNLPLEGTNDSTKKGNDACKSSFLHLWYCRLNGGLRSA